MAQGTNINFPFFFLNLSIRVKLESHLLTFVCHVLSVVEGVIS